MIPSPSIGAPLPPSSANVKDPSRSATISSDFDTFLKMLTAQARHQDPLKPIDSTEYAAQLAQFSMVEQQVQTNDTLTALVSQIGLSNMASIAGWVGMDARAVTPVIFDGAPITVSPNPAASADSAFLVVSDLTGAVVQRLEIPVGTEPLQWAGVDAEGSPLTKGSYQFTVESRKGDEVILSEAAEITGRIIEAQIRGGAVFLVLEGGQTILSTAVTGLRQSA